MGKFRSYRDSSRIDFGKTMEEGQDHSRADLEFGCMLRIADATEKMADNYDKLISDRDKYKRWYEQERANVKRLENSIRSYRGAITKLKKTKL